MKKMYGWMIKRKLFGRFSNHTFIPPLMLTKFYFFGSLRLELACLSVCLKD